jgi:hypothetical protein
MFIEKALDSSLLRDSTGSINFSMVGRPWSATVMPETVPGILALLGRTAPSRINNSGFLCGRSQMVADEYRRAEAQNPDQPCLHPSLLVNFLART